MPTKLQPLRQWGKLGHPHSMVARAVTHLRLCGIAYPVWNPRIAHHQRSALGSLLIRPSETSLLSKSSILEDRYRKVAFRTGIGNSSPLRISLYTGYSTIRAVGRGVCSKLLMPRAPIHYHHHGSGARLCWSLLSQSGVLLFLENHDGPPGILQGGRDTGSYMHGHREL
jgi:hypothetical protein